MLEMQYRDPQVVETAGCLSPSVGHFFINPSIQNPSGGQIWVKYGGGGKTFYHNNSYFWAISTNEAPTCATSAKNCPTLGN